VLADDFGQGRMLAIWDVVKQGDSRLTAVHSEYAIDLSGKDCALGKLLSTKSCLIDFDWPWQLQIRQHLCLDEQGARLSDQLKVLDDLVPVTHNVLGQPRPHIVNPEIHGYVEKFNVEVAEGRVHRDTLADATAAALPNQLRATLGVAY